MDNIDEDILLYTAGFLDGEGCFSVQKNWKITVSCANTNRPIIEWLKNNFGGSICKNGTRLRRENHRRIYSWQLVSRQAGEFCKMIAPYLKEKTEQALLLIAIQQTMGKRRGKCVPLEIVEERNYLANKVKELKHVAW